ncbi:MAG TPA: hypothetical protein VLL95_02710 [Phnomibacter sp.]|nr:hypothetical protein [Phnomibacter sp.]
MSSCLIVGATLNFKQILTMADTVNKEPARNWGKTLFDFFMLFLAVTLGFLADSYRDKQEER